MTTGPFQDEMKIDSLKTWPGYRKIPNKVNITEEVLNNHKIENLGNKTAFIFEGGKLSYQLLKKKVNAFSVGLQTLGIKPKEKILIRLQNCPEFIIAFLAIIKIGAIPVLQNSSLGPKEAEYVCIHSDVVAAITESNVLSSLKPFKRQFLKGLIIVGSNQNKNIKFDKLLKPHFGKDVPTFETKANDPAFIVYTSGTTGRPKGIVHAHRWIIAQGDINKLRVPPHKTDIIMATGEWSFISALGHNALFPLRNNLTGAILKGRMNPERVLQAIDRYNVTLLYSVATVYRRILAVQGIENTFNLGSLRACNATGEALEAETYKLWNKRFNCPIWEHYGVSEMQLVFGQSPHWKIKPGSVGKPLPGTSIEILNDNSKPVKSGETGQLVIGSDNPGFFLRYHKDSKTTQKVVHDGWYHTGDLAYADQDGYIWIVGRKDDCFKSRGIFISPIEIENELRKFESITEACVVGKFDKEIGKKIYAFVVLREKDNKTKKFEDQLKNSLRKQIAHFKVPHTIKFLDELPKSAVGKILRKKLVQFN